MKAYPKITRKPTSEIIWLLYRGMDAPNSILLKFTVKGLVYLKILFFLMRFLVFPQLLYPVIVSLWYWPVWVGTAWKNY